MWKTLGLKIYFSSLTGIKKKGKYPCPQWLVIAMLTSERLRREDQMVLQNPGIVLTARELPSRALTVDSIRYDFEASVALPDFYAEKSQATLQHNVRLMARSRDLKKKKRNRKKSVLDSFICPLMFKPLVVPISKLLSENMTTRNFT